jgi:hypothetical protein
MIHVANVTVLGLDGFIPKDIQSQRNTKSLPDDIGNRTGPEPGYLSGLG